jgi:tetratricopeptide (TPR) repeat protein
VDFDPADPGNLLYARPADHWKIFVSSEMASGALREERAAAVTAINNFPIAKAWAWELQASAGPYSSERECVRQAGTSDGLVLILHDELTPVTRAEFEAARQAHAPVFLMLKQPAERDTSLQRFIDEVRSFAITVNFESLGELQTQITHSLREWAVRSGRSAMLRAADRQADVPAVLPTDPFRGVELQTPAGDFVSVASVVQGARAKAEQGKSQDALEDIWELAQFSYDADLGWLALSLVDALEEFVDWSVVDDQWRGWILNTRGLALGSLERRAEAATSFNQMRQIGRALDDTDLQGTALQNLGVQALIAERYPEALKHLGDSLKLKRETQDWRGLIQVLTNLVNVFIGTGNLATAERLTDDIAQMLEGIRDPGLRSTLHGIRGMLAVRHDDLKTARDEFRAALEAARRSGSTSRIIDSMQSLGAVALDLGQPAQARRWYAKALAQAEQIDDLPQRRRQRQALALSLMRMGEPEQAAASFLHAAEEATQLGDSTGAAVALGDAGACLLEAKDPEGARSLTEQALATPTDNGDEWRASQLFNLAAELRALNDPEQALQRLIEAANLTGVPEDGASYLRQAGELAVSSPSLVRKAAGIFEQELDIRREREDTERWAWRAAEIGATLLHTAANAEARDFFSIALRVFARRDRRQAFFIRNDRALASADLHDLPAAVRDLHQCLRIAEDLNDRVLLQQAHMNLGELERRRNRDEIVIQHLNTALVLAQQLEDLSAEASTRSLLALHAQDIGEDPEAVDEHLAALDEIVDGLGEPRLQAQAAKARAHSEFSREHYRAAEKLYTRAVRLLGDDPSIALAESLGGQVVSAASRGRLEEDALQRVADLSWLLGWDDALVVDLDIALAGLVNVDANDAIPEFASTTLAIALRRLGSRQTADTGDRLLSRIALRIAGWVIADENISERRGRLLENGVEETVGADTTPDVMQLIDNAIAVVREHQEQQDRAPDPRPNVPPEIQHRGPTVHDAG